MYLYASRQLINLLFFFPYLFSSIEDKNTKKGGYAENEEIECTTPPSPLDELNVCLFLVKNIQSSGLEEQLSPSSSLYCSLSEEARGCLGSVLDYVRGRSG